MDTKPTAPKHQPSRPQWLRTMLKEIDAELSSGHWQAESPAVSGELRDLRAYLECELQAPPVSPRMRSRHV